MYNRYIPQSDGTYRKRPVPDRCPPEKPTPKPPEKPGQKPPEKPPCPPRPRASSKEPKGNIFSQLRQLLPRDFEVGDLLVVLLLLLMSGENEEDQNTALLTLALYFFL